MYSSKTISNKIGLSDILFLISIIIFNISYTFFVAIQYTNQKDFYFNYLYTISGLLGVLLFVFLLQKKTATEQIIGISSVMVFVIGTYIYRDVTPLFGLLVIITLRKVRIPRNQIIMIDLILRIFLISIVFLLWKYGVLFDSEFTRITSTGVSVRHTYGFGNPNTYGLYLISIVGELLYLFANKRFNFFRIVFGLISLTYIVKITDSRSAEIVGIVIFLVFLLKNKLSNLNLNITKWLPIIFSGLSIISANYFNQSNVLWSKLDSVLSNRLLFNSYFWETIPKSLFGHKIIQVTNQQALNSFGLLQGRILTNFYLTIFLGFGVFGFITVIYHLIKLISVSLSRNDAVEVLLFSTYLLLGLMENSILNIFINWTLLAMIPTNVYTRTTTKKSIR